MYTWVGWMWVNATLMECCYHSQAVPPDSIPTLFILAHLVHHHHYYPSRAAYSPSHSRPFMTPPWSHKGRPLALCPSLLSLRPLSLGIRYKLHKSRHSLPLHSWKGLHPFLPLVLHFVACVPWPLGQFGHLLHSFELLLNFFWPQLHYLWRK